MFFKTKNYLKGDDIANNLNVSLATINKDMRRVRDFLQSYGIVLHSAPYYGMILRGKEQAIRSCMMDLLDVYSDSEEPLFFESGLEKYGLRKKTG